MKKLLSFLCILLISFFLYSGGKKIVLDARNSAKRIQSEVMIEGDMNVAPAQKEQEKKQTDSVYVPYYWKTGLSAEDNDFLKGYLPSIYQFSLESEVRDLILYPGAKESKLLTIDDVSTILSLHNTIYVKGIVNMNDRFVWEEESCFTVYSKELEKNLFSCDFWLNWASFSSEDEHFSLTQCRINNVDGYCVFLDYLQEFYNRKKSLDTRCIGDNSSDLKCDFISYKEGI